MNSEEIINQKSIFICGKEEKLTQLSIDTLLIKECQHFYLEDPPRQVLDYFQKMTDDSRFSVINSVQSLKQAELLQYDVIVCGLRPASSMKMLSRHLGQIHIFFSQSLGMFRSLWEKLKASDLRIYEHSFSEFVQGNYSGEEEKSPDPVETEDIYFTNRGISFEQHREFINNSTLRSCSILGLGGIGKRSFLRQLKLSQGLSNNCFELSFFSKYDDIVFLLERLFKMMAIPFNQDDLSKVTLSARIFEDVIISLFKGFDSKKNSRIIFYDFHFVFDNRNRKFYDKNIGIFFDKLLSRDSFSGNKIYIVSNESFVFPRPSSRDLSCEILLPPLHAKQIQLILEHEFNRRSKNQLAIAIMKYSYDAIGSLLNGHPQIAKLLVEACDNYPLDSLVNDERFRKKFDQEKVSYLMERIELAGEELSLLSFLSLFLSDFPVEAVFEKTSISGQSIEVLRKKFLLEKQDFTDGSCRYYVPEVVKTYAAEQLSKEEKEENHQIIGNYYWCKADSTITNSADVLNYYRLSLYHFECAGNRERQDQLAVYFKGIFLSRARDAYKARSWEEAVQYFEPVIKQSVLECADLTRFLNCHSKLRNDCADDMFKEAERSCGRNDFFLATYADHHLRNSNYEEAYFYCKGALNLDETSIVANGTYPRIIDATDGTQAAINWLDERIDTINFTMNNSTHKNKLLSIYYINLYSFLEFQELLKKAFYDVIYVLKSVGLFSDSALEVSPSISEERVDEVVSHFDKALRKWSGKFKFYYTYPARYLSIIQAYATYLFEHGRTTNANEILHRRKENAIEDNGQTKLCDEEWRNIVGSIWLTEKITEDDFYKRYPGLQDCLQGESLEEISSETGILVIDSIMSYCKRVMKDSEAALIAYTKTDPHDFEALYALAYLASRYEKVEYIEKIVIFCTEHRGTKEEEIPISPQLRSSSLEEVADFLSSTIDQLDQIIDRRAKQMSDQSKYNFSNAQNVQIVEQNHGQVVGIKYSKDLDPEVKKIVSNLFNCLTQLENMHSQVVTESEAKTIIDAEFTEIYSGPQKLDRSLSSEILKK